MKRDIVTSAIGILILTLLCGIAYPLVVTGVSQVAFPGNANGQKVYIGHKLVGSKIIGQNFGTVVTGQLEGYLPLNVGDCLVCDGASWQVSGIEQFRSKLTTAEPGADIGILLRNGPSGDVLRGRAVTFEQGTSRFGQRSKNRRWRP